MRLTESRLRKLIREELKKTKLNERVRVQAVTSRFDVPFVVSTHKRQHLDKLLEVVNAFTDGKFEYWILDKDKIEGDPDLYSDSIASWAAIFFLEGDNLSGHMETMTAEEYARLSSYTMKKVVHAII